jgi:short-subunit dehydrogenase
MGRVGGKVALVTGGASGIGAGCAEVLGREGAKVVVTDIQDLKGQEIVAAIKKAGGQARYLHHDVTSEGAWVDIVADVEKTEGRLDILVNNAGIGLHGTIADTSASDVETLFRLNVLAAAAAIRAVVPTMRAQRAGMIINISSIAGRIVVPRIGYYSASKFALTAIGDALRLEEAHHGIQVINVFPGTTRSSFSENRLGSRGRAAHQRVPPVPAEKVARRIADAVEHNRSSVYVSWVPDRLAVVANHVAGWAVRGVLRRWARHAQA